MTQEDRELLLKDLLGRVLYDVKVDYHGDIFALGYNLYLNNTNVAFINYPMLFYLEKNVSVKPYLRPMSSMTEEEKREYNSFSLGEDLASNPYMSVPAFHVLDWLNSHYFDYRGLIDKGIALEAPKEMYETNEINPQ